MKKEFFRQYVLGHGKYISVIVLSGIIFLFIAPWLWIDGGENILESRFFRGREAEIFKNLIDDCKIKCDGSCYKIDWVPFGIRVSACSEDYYFISFWGQRFYINENLSY